MKKILLHKRPSSLDSMSRLRGEELSRRNANEEAERLSILGQTSDLKALKWVQEEAKKMDLAQQANQDKAFFYLERHRKNPKHYNEILVEWMQEFLYDEDIPVKYPMTAEWDNSKVSLQVADYVKGFKTSFTPKYDLFAAKMMAIKAGNTVGRLEGYVSQTDSGILTPDKDEAKLIMEEYGQHYKRY